VRRTKRRVEAAQNLEDQKAARQRGRKWLRRRKAAREKWHELLASLGAPLYNPNATRDNNKLFFKHLGVQPRKWSEKTGAPSLDEKQLTELVVHPNKLVALAARTLLRYRRWTKMKTTYIDGLELDAHSVVHPTWNVHGARTLRWSSQDPNFQNIPKPVVVKTKSGSKKVIRPGLRDLFVGFEPEIATLEEKDGRYATDLR